MNLAFQSGEQGWKNTGAMLSELSRAAIEPFPQVTAFLSQVSYFPWGWPLWGVGSRDERGSCPPTLSPVAWVLVALLPYSLILSGNIFFTVKPGSPRLGTNYLRTFISSLGKGKGKGGNTHSAYSRLALSPLMFEDDFCFYQAFFCHRPSHMVSPLPWMNFFLLFADLDSSHFF